MDNKLCSVCKIEKNIKDFNKNKDRKIGIRSECKDCANKKRREYRRKNKLEVNRKYREYINKVKENGGPLNNKMVGMSEEEKMKKRSEYMVKYNKERSLIDPLYKLKINLRRNISSLKGNL